MNPTLKVIELDIKIEKIETLINGYWSNEIWDIYDSHFDELRPSIWKSKPFHLFFREFKGLVKKEIQYFFAHKLIHRQLKLSTVVAYGESLKNLSGFLTTYYPFINSLAEVPFTKGRMEYRTYIINTGHRLIASDKKPSRPESFFRQLLIFFKEFYDTRDEYSKDVWDLQKIPGSKTVLSLSTHRLNFEKIPDYFKDLAKRYFKCRITRLSVVHCKKGIIALYLFLNFIHKEYPAWRDLNDLSRRDMENYLSYYNNLKGGLKKSADNILALRQFLEYIQVAQYPEAPKTLVQMLLFREDIPKYRVYNENTIKYIPEEVLQQLDDNIQHIKPLEYIPYIIVLRASGWRMIDILNLRYDRCLEKTSQGWYLCGDITKTQVLNHKVPINDEVAAVILSQIEEIKEKSTADNNPHKFLFVRFDGRRKGLPPTADRISRALNLLAEKINIVDKNGNVFHFGNHAFRHTKGVELINNGMDILHVQKWMAHASPEMTLRYAKILDTTMRKSWERIVKEGIFKINGKGGTVEKIDLSNIQDENLIEWEYIRHNLDAVRIPLGFCLKSSKIVCNHQINPCLLCNNMCTSPEFLAEIEEEIKETTKQIERAIALGRSMWVEKNQAVLERLEMVATVLKGGKIYHKAGKKRREYVGGERENARRT